MRALLEAERRRLSAVEAARDRRDAAAQEYARKRRVLALLEGCEIGHPVRGVNEQRLQAARADVQRSRLAWQRAQRELLRAI